MGQRAPETHKCPGYSPVQNGDPSPDGKGVLSIARAIEVGHIFQVGTKYSAAMKVQVLDEKGKNQTLIMGCYGIGVTRIVAASIEQNHDNRGIIWPEAIAPFQVALLPMNMHKSERLREATENLHQTLLDANIDVLFDNRKVRLGFMFADMELIGIPRRVVLSDSGLDSGSTEYKRRGIMERYGMALEQVVSLLKSSL